MMTSRNNFPTLSARLKNFLVDEKHTDCSFTFDHKEPLYCHKLILSTASPVFEAMFYGPLAETSQIPIKDISRDIFHMMLDFIYTDDMTITRNTTCCFDLIDLFLCADKYLINELANNCLASLRDSLRHNNILSVLDLTVELDIQPMMRDCLSFFRDCFLSSRSFKDLLACHYEHISKNTLQLIVSKCQTLQRNVIALVREWCEHELKRLELTEEHLEELVKSLNLSQDILDMALDTSQERENLIMYEGTNRNDDRRWTFCQRTYYKAVRPLQLARTPTTDSTRFFANHYIELHAISINSRLKPFIKNIPSKYNEQVAVQILHNKSDVAYEELFYVKNVTYNSTIRLVFHRPVKIPCLVLYTIRVCWEGCENGVQAEYPRSLYSDCERGKDCIISFYDDSDLPSEGSVLTSLEYDTYPFNG